MTDSLAALLRAHRLAASLTQEALAERAALSATAIAAIERGRRTAPRLSTLRQIARALDLSQEDLAELVRAAQTADGLAGDERASSSDRSLGPQEGLEASRHLLPPSDGLPIGGGYIPLPPSVARRWRTDFVGRVAELVQLQACWERRTRFVLVAGEPGIGKTRLVTQLARSLPEDDVTVLWGRCSEERLGAYMPFVEILHQLIADADPSVLRESVGGRGELTRLVPDLGEHAGPLRAPTQADAATEQRLLFEAIATLLGHWKRLLVVVDDLHWADEATISLLGYLVRDPRLDGVVIMATARDLDLDARHSGVLAEAARQAEMSTIRLGGLGEKDLGLLVAELVGARVGSDVVSSVASATEGNPFFAEEMTIQMVDAGLVIDAEDVVRLHQPASPPGVPERVRETLTRRLLSLPPDAIELLSVGSVIGREFELSVAATAAGLGGLGLVDAVDDGLLSGLVVETPSGSLAFSHALVQDAVGERLSLTRRVRTHRLVAEAIESRWPEHQAVAADLARHWAVVAAVDPSAETIAATWAVRAGDVALAAAAADEAIARYEQASLLWATATLGHADALIRLGTALQYRGRADDADNRFREAFQLAAGLGDATLQARAAIGLGRRYPYWETDRSRTKVLEASLAALPPEAELLRLTLMGLIVTQLIGGFHPDEALRRDELAEHLAAVAEAPATTDEVLLSLGRTRIYDCIEEFAVLNRVALRLVGLAESHNDLQALAGARFAQGLAALDGADMHGLAVAVHRYGAVADQLDDPRERSQAETAQSTIAVIEGRYDEAAALSDSALEHGKASGDYNAELLYYAQGLFRAVDLGQASIVLPLIVDATDYQNIASFAAGTALTAAFAGELGLAGEILDRLMAEGLGGMPRGADRLAPTAFLAHACVLMNATRFARGLHEALSNQPAIAVRVGPLVGWWGTVDHHLGALDRLLGDLDGAETHLRRALALEEQMGARPFAVRTQAELAHVLALKGGGLTAEAEELAERTLMAAEALGAPGIAAEVAVLCATA
jgi:transcriptional regulator with XRE-family HTH domain/tetratricopeptide (TPR) repeat protein